MHKWKLWGVCENKRFPRIFLRIPKSILPQFVSDCFGICEYRLLTRPKGPKLTLRKPLVATESLNQHQPETTFSVVDAGN